MSNRFTQAFLENQREVISKATKGRKMWRYYPLYGSRVDIILAPRPDTTKVESLLNGLNKANDGDYLVSAANYYPEALSRIELLQKMLVDAIELGNKIREEATLQEPFSDCPEMLDEWDNLVLKIRDDLGTKE